MAVISALIEAGTNPFTFDVYCRSPLATAIKYNVHPDVVGDILKLHLTGIDSRIAALEHELVQLKQGQEPINDEGTVLTEMVLPFEYQAADGVSIVANETEFSIKCGTCCCCLPWPSRAPSPFPLSGLDSTSEYNFVRDWHLSDMSDSLEVPDALFLLASRQGRRDMVNQHGLSEITTGVDSFVSALLPSPVVTEAPFTGQRFGLGVQ